MSVVVLKIADYSYKIACQDGQETHIQELANYLDSKAKKLLTSVGGYIPENQLLAMVSVLTAQEMFTAKNQKDTAVSVDETTVTVLKELTDRINSIADQLSQE